MGRIAKAHTSSSHHNDAWKPMCPKCGRTRQVGELCGGENPKYYCGNCLVEFSVKKRRGAPISATVHISTFSGMRVGNEDYFFDATTGRFVPGKPAKPKD